MSALTRPRAGRPVNTLVIRVALSLAAASARRWKSGVAASGLRRNAVPTCTAAAPSASAARMPRASAMPPAAITGRSIASTTCGSSANSPGWPPTSSSRNMPRWPPASTPCAMTASTPRAASQRASATVVAVDSTTAPVLLTRSSRRASGRPKWKLTTSGRSSSTSAAAASSNGRRPAEAVAGTSRPSRACSGASAARHRATAASVGGWSRWAKKFRFNGASMAARKRATSWRIRSGASVAPAIAPRPPARAMAMASPASATPAIGASSSGIDRPSRCTKGWGSVRVIACCRPEDPQYARRPGARRRGPCAYRDFRPISAGGPLP